MLSTTSEINLEPTFVCGPKSLNRPKRLPMGVSLYIRPLLTNSQFKQLKEVTTINISATGAAIISEISWQPGERLEVFIAHQASLLRAGTASVKHTTPDLIDERLVWVVGFEMESVQHWLIYGS